MTKLRVLDLFSGIGGFSLGLERTGGFETVAFCEIEDYPRRVLAKHWPKVPCYNDVRELTGARLAADGIAVDVICGGFPCQDISFAGKGAGLAGERSGLWREYARIIRELRPRFVIVENVSALLSRGLADVLGSLAALGYDAEWHCIPASAVGAPHRRDRLWIVAYPGGEQHEGRGLAIRRALAAQLHAADTDSEGEHAGAVDAEVGRSSQPMANAGGQRHKPDGEPGELASASRSVEGERHQRKRRRGSADGRREDVADTNGSDRHGRRRDVQVGRERITRETPNDGLAGRAQWFVEPAVCRVAHGVPARVDRLCGLGNAVVPQIPQLIGQAILQAEGLTT